ncbi:AlpA family transcriptional regulator [Salmonella enterica]|nr:AlpA family transcriptional regulator [Salmonella enterica]ECD0156101.1 AlpA family transcriptional regulator [Salmonella enterica subsp. enterica]ECD4438644.1 AlpA family transcriptional regulator [Salmonella enterica subsp. enterica serovar Florida]ECT3490072.1 AlpA family transcriptional regulator [Salmonella enterica subsp. enterica serovar Braenderup]EEG1557524.1 AlpA family transcriptional regulator [Salmonella enterica subsp. enterica serovar Midway]
MSLPTSSNEYKTQKLIRLPKVIEITGKSRTRIYEDMKANLFPKAIKTGSRSVAWVEQEIAEWIEDKKKQRFQN